MLSERVQRMMMGTILVAVLFLFNYQETMIASILLIGVIGMVYMWAIFDFCPSLWVLGKVFKEDSKVS